jgi:hypothetical protein
MILLLDFVHSDYLPSEGQGVEIGVHCFCSSLVTYYQKAAAVSSNYNYCALVSYQNVELRVRRFRETL